MVLDCLTLRYNEYTPEERVRMGRYDAENAPTKAVRHFANRRQATGISCEDYVAAVTSFLGG